jgi:hypothetical protein
MGFGFSITDLLSHLRGTMKRPMRVFAEFWPDTEHLWATSCARFSRRLGSAGSWFASFPGLGAFQQSQMFNELSEDVVFVWGGRVPAEVDS